MSPSQTQVIVSPALIVDTFVPLTSSTNCIPPWPTWTTRSAAVSAPAPNETQRAAAPRIGAHRRNRANCMAFMEASVENPLVAGRNERLRVLDGSERDALGVVLDELGAGLRVDDPQV